MKPFDKVIILRDEIFGTRTIHNFREYATEMMLPDPTYVIMTDEVSDMVTDFVNNGGDVWKAFSALVSDYQHDNNGREYVAFPEAEKVQEVLQKIEKVC